jgi:hypothetical protein
LLIFFIPGTEAQRLFLSNFTIKIAAHDIPMQPISIKIPRLRPPLLSRRCDSRIWKGQENIVNFLPQRHRGAEIGFIGFLV